MRTKVTYAIVRIEAAPETDADEILADIVKLEHKNALTMIDVTAMREVTEGDDAELPVLYWP